MADKSPANQMSELLTCMKTDISNDMLWLPNLNMADGIMRFNPHKIQLNAIKIDLTLILRCLIFTFYTLGLPVGGYSRLLSFYIQI
jgi:hypothetical protein